MKNLIITLLLTTNTYAINLKAGTWEQTVNINASALMMSPEIKAQMAMLPKEQAQMMLNMISSQMKPKVTKECVTEQMIKDPTAFIPKKEDCTAKILSNQASTFKAALDCKGNIKGEITITASSDTAYVGSFQGVDNTGSKSSIEFSGKHVATTCQK